MHLTLLDFVIGFVFVVTVVLVVARLEATRRDVPRGRPPIRLRRDR